MLAGAAAATLTGTAEALGIAPLAATFARPPDDVWYSGGLLLAAAALSQAGLGALAEMVRRRGDQRGWGCMGKEGMAREEGGSEGMGLHGRGGGVGGKEGMAGEEGIRGGVVWEVRKGIRGDGDGVVWEGRKG